MNYRLSVEFEAVEFLLSLSKVDQARLAWWLERLKNSPFSSGHAVTSDRTGREIQIGKVDRFQIFYWSDHAVNTVRVTQIEWNN